LIREAPLPCILEGAGGVRVPFAGGGAPGFPVFPPPPPWLSGCSFLPSGPLFFPPPPDAFPPLLHHPPALPGPPLLPPPPPPRFPASVLFLPSPPPSFSSPCVPRTCWIELTPTPPSPPRPPATQRLRSDPIEQTHTTHPTTPEKQTRAGGPIPPQGGDHSGRNPGVSSGFRPSSSFKDRVGRGPGQYFQVGSFRIVRWRGGPPTQASAGRVDKKKKNGGPGKSRDLAAWRVVGPPRKRGGGRDKD